MVLTGYMHSIQYKKTVVTLLGELRFYDSEEECEEDGLEAYNFLFTKKQLEKQGAFVVDNIWKQCKRIEEK